MNDEHQGSADAWRVCYEAEKAEVSRLLCEGKTALELLKAAKCPNCDGSGAYMINMSSTNAELQQCQWCAERKALVSEGRATDG